MKIVDNRLDSAYSTTCTFGELNPGDVFYVEKEDSFYLKTDDEIWNTLNLNTLIFNEYSNNGEVQFVKSQLTIDRPSINLNAAPRIIKTPVSPNDPTLTFEIYIGTNLIGSGKLTKEWIHSLEIKTFYRNRGYGTQLIIYIIKHGGRKLFVNESNINAIRLYEKLGFKKFANDERKGYIDMELEDNIELKDIDIQEKCDGETVGKALKILSYTLKQYR